MYNEKAIENFITNFQNKDFQDELKSVRDDLYSIFIEFIEFIRTKNLISDNQLIISAPEARVKRGKSLREKIIRKKYYDEWNLREDLDFDVCKSLSLKKLPDLIGLRINCYFFDDEEFITNLFLNNNDVKKYFDEKKISFKDDFLELPHETIYKFNGTFKRFTTTYNFELQIKSLVHSMWGEVDHKTIYKEQQYDINRTLKKKIELGVFENLKNSNMQLLNIYKNSHEEIDLVKALFFEYTKSKVAEKLKIQNIQSKYYYYFFNVFKTESIIKIIREYISFAVISKDFEKQEYNNLIFTDELKKELHDRLKIELKNIMSDRKYSYVFENFYALLDCLYQTITEDEMLSFIAYNAINENYVDTDFHSDIIDSESDEDDDDDNQEKDDNLLFEKVKQDFIDTSVKEFKDRVSNID